MFVHGNNGNPDSANFARFHVEFLVGKVNLKFGLAEVWEAALANFTKVFGVVVPNMTSERFATSETAFVAVQAHCRPIWMVVSDVFRVRGFRLEANIAQGTRKLVDQKWKTLGKLSEG